MKNGNILLIGGAILALTMFMSKSANAEPTYNGIDLGDLGSQYGDYEVSLLQLVLNELATRDLSDLQMRMMAAQILQETGLFTDSPNLHAVETYHNYAGISRDGHLKAYDSISNFVDDYLRVLGLGSTPPLYASNIVDFNSRLKANGYYEDSQTTYGNNLNFYFNLLS